jgi:phosphoglycerate kinase
MQDGAVTEDTRVRAAPTILELADKGAKVLLLAHFGRPKGKRVPISRSRWSWAQWKRCWAAK